jgi:hypothetical protein
MAKFSRELAEQIVKVVAMDPTCQKRIPVSGQETPSRWRGFWRDAAIIVGNPVDFVLDRKNEETSALICTGVAEATVAAIQNAVLSKKLTGVLSAVDIERDSGMNHSATTVVLGPRPNVSQVVFDWFETLDLWNPLIYPSTHAFLSDTGWVHYSQFRGLQ